MFEFYRDCIFEVQNSSSYIGFFIQIIGTIISLSILYIAYTNLLGLRRTQSVQIHMNLITLENEVRKNSENLRMATNKHKKTTDINADIKELELALLIETRDNAFVLYVTFVDKLASLVNTDYLKKQFQNRDWKTEYIDIFKDARSYFDYYDIEISGKSQMIRNINILLDIWDKENSNNLTENLLNTTIINSLSNT